MVQIQLIGRDEFDAIRRAPLDEHERVAIIADMCRYNTLNAVKLAGSGHLGSSFSAMDIVAWLYHGEMNVREVGIDSPHRDVYFSSKGHDVPGLYAVLHSLGIVPEEKLRRLRRLGGLDGHPDVGVRGIESNSGSLGMGISKGRGIAWAKRHRKLGGRVFVLTGDGELQEGQNYEALQTTVQQGITNLTVIVDHNKLQTDKLISEITDLLDLEKKVAAFGWHVRRVDGHDIPAFARLLRELETVTDRPKFIIADTIKGRGIPFMEHPRALRDNQGLYRWHAGAPDDESFTKGQEALWRHIVERLGRHGMPAPRTSVAPQESGGGASGPREFVADAYGRELVKLSRERPDLIVLDGDLSADCRLREFEKTFPDRFIENGIAEQDMVSMAGGLARHGLLPVVNTFASFLAARANEQIYNNATERSKIVYVCHYAGLIPAGPGKSHQSIRDISLFAALPDCVIVQPATPRETEMAIRFCVQEASGTCVLRLVIGPSPRQIELPADYQLRAGRGVRLADGDDAVMFAYGPVMLHEALVASELLHRKGFGLRVVNMPWLNRCDIHWLAQEIGDVPSIYVVEDHAPRGALGDSLLHAMAANAVAADRRVRIFAVEGYPACGTPVEALRRHQLDGASLAARVLDRSLESLTVDTAAGEPGRYTSEAPQ